MTDQSKWRRPPMIVRSRDPYVDPTAVERVVKGSHPFPLLNRREVREASRLLTRRGTPASAIADRVGVRPRTVYRWRAADRTGN